MNEGVYYILLCLLPIGAVREPDLHHGGLVSLVCCCSPSHVQARLYQGCSQCSDTEDCDNIAFFSSFPLNSDVLRSLRSLRQPPSDSAPVSAPLLIPSSPSPFPMTRVLCYGLFLVFTDLFPVFPRACIILR